MGNTRSQQAARTLRVRLRRRVTHQVGVVSTSSGSRGGSCRSLKLLGLPAQARMQSMRGRGLAGRKLRRAAAAISKRFVAGMAKQRRFGVAGSPTPTNLINCGSNRRTPKGPVGCG